MASSIYPKQAGNVYPINHQRRRLDLRYNAPNSEVRVYRIINGEEVLVRTETGSGYVLRRQRGRPRKNGGGNGS